MLKKGFNRMLLIEGCAGFLIEGCAGFLNHPIDVYYRHGENIFSVAMSYNFIQCQSNGTSIKVAFWFFKDI